MNPKFIIFLAIVVGIMGLYFVFYDLYLRRLDRIRERIKEETEAEPEDEKPQGSPLFKDQRAFLTKIAEQDDLEIPRRPIRQIAEEFVMQSGLKMTLPDLIKQSLLFAGISLVVVLLFFPNPLMALLFAVIGAILPWLRVKRAKTSRQEAILKQLPDAFDLIARVLRSGMSIGMAVKAVAEEFEDPLGTEIAYCYEQQNLGMSPETAFRNLANRTGILEIRLFVTALSVQQKTGGNLAELIDKLSQLIRDRFRLRGQIETLTAEGRFQAILLFSLPFLMFLILTLMNPQYELQLLEHPKLILGTVGMMLVGGFWIKKIVTFDG